MVFQDEDTETTGSAEGSVALEAERCIDTWRGELGGQTSVSASDVQNRLLDLWGDLPDGEIRTSVETWLSETLDRSLYSVSDVFDRLDRLEGALADSVAG